MIRPGPEPDVDLTGQRPRFDPVAGTLVGGECSSCGAQTWPRRAVCYRCGSDEVVATSLPVEGRLVTWTRVWVPVEGIEPPYLVGLVELGRLQLFGHLREVADDLTTPADVQVRVDLDREPPYWFEPSAP